MDGQSCYRFTRAIARTPGDSCVDGLRNQESGAPDPDRFRNQHRVYLDVLVRAGVDVTVLPPDEDFPDSVFVEDTALCLPEGAVVLRPGAPSRRGETAAIEPVLQQHFDGEVRFLPPDGQVDGGDVLVTEREVLIGVSSRTSAAGASSLKTILEHWGYPTRITHSPGSVLHLKSDCASLGCGIVLSTPRLVASGLFDEYLVIQVAEGEDAAANALRVNDTILMAEGYGQTAEALDALALPIEQVPNSEAARLDGGLSCMSLRF